MMDQVLDRVVKSWKTTGVGLAGSMAGAYCAAGHPMDLKTIGMIALPVVMGALFKEQGVSAAPNGNKPGA